MQLEAAFRRSLYLSLALASLALVVAEDSFLTEMPIVGVLVGMLLLVAYYLEGRWSLSLSSANTVGMILTAILGIWIAYQFFRPPSESLIYQLPWPTSLLPYLGPVLLILIPAKLYRPKEIGDYWAMYGLGLMAVALGCSMAEEGIFGLILVLWLMVFVWSLTLFYLYRESNKQVTLQVDSSPANHSRVGRFPLFRKSGRWSLGIVIVGLIGFLATPRLVSSRWHLTLRTKMETGISMDSQIDLNNTGNLKINEETAYQVFAEDAKGNPKLDLDPSMRWRSVAMAKYAGGRWLRDRQGATITLEMSCRPRVFNEPNPSRDTKSSTQLGRLPDLGPGQYFLNFQPTVASNGVIVLADPAFWKAGELPPIISPLATNSEIWINWQQLPDTSFSWPRSAGSSMLPVWCQTRVEGGERDLSPTMYIVGNTISGVYYDYSAVPNLVGWTDRLIEKLIRDHVLLPEIRERGVGDGRRKQKYHERIAHALSDHLSNSGEYQYTLDLTRKDRRLDPTEDFLYNLKAGHCERYATALTLMLRTQGIPCQIILGYKGCEPVGDGNYVIRQSHAHAWVEILVPREPRPDDPPLPDQKNRPLMVPPLRFHWVTLDPTPELGGSEDANGSNTWLQDAQNRGVAFFKNFILGYNSDLRQKAGEAFVGFFERAWDPLSEGKLSTEALILFLPPFLYSLWRVRRSLRNRSRITPDGESAASLLAKVAPFHARLLQILERFGFVARASQTALEFANSVQHQLTQRIETQTVAAVPVEAASLYYRVRFGQETISVQESEQLQQRLNALELALTPRVAPA